MKKRRLKKWVVICLNIIAIITIGFVLAMTLKSYMDDLKKCDEIKGHTCNIFGK